MRTLATPVSEFSSCVLWALTLVTTLVLTLGCGKSPTLEETEPTNDAGMDAATQLPRCGDGIVQPEDGEECDDENDIDGDCCSHDCKIETGPDASPCCSAEGTCRTGEECGAACDQPGVCQKTETQCECVAEPKECGLSEGAYRFNSSSGALAFACEPANPLGDVTIWLNVSAPDDDCVHSVVVPPAGFASETICVEGGTLSTRIRQTACGGGRIDSNGGSDFTLTEVGDTSTPCSSQQDCTPGTNGGYLSYATMGDGKPDVCSCDGGGANVVLSVWAEMQTWFTAGGECPDHDGRFQPYPHFPGGAECPRPGGIRSGDEECVPPDVLVSEFRFALDLTTDTVTASFEDVIEDGCSFAGEGCAGPITSGGAPNQCFDPESGNITLHAAGPSGSETPGWPSYDALWTTTMTGTLTRVGERAGTVCPTEPIHFTNGTTSARCFVPTSS